MPRATRSTRKREPVVPQELPVSRGRDVWPKGYKKKNLAILPDLEADVDMTSEEKDAVLIMPPDDDFTEELLEKIRDELRHMGIEEILHHLTLFDYDVQKTIEYLKEVRILDPLLPFVKQFFFHNVWRVRMSEKAIRAREIKLWETKGIWEPKSPGKYFYCARKLNGLATPQELANLYYNGKHEKGIREPFLDPRIDLNKLNELVDVMVKMGITIEDGSIERRQQRRLEKKRMLALKDQPRDENGMIVEDNDENKENGGKKERKDKKKAIKEKGGNSEKKPENHGEPLQEKKVLSKPAKRENTKEVVGPEELAVKDRKDDEDPKKAPTTRKKSERKGKKEVVEDQKQPDKPEDPIKKDPAQPDEGEPMDVDRKNLKRKRKDPKQEEEKKPEVDDKDKPPPLRSMQWQRAERLRIQMEEEEKKRNKGKKGKKAVKEPEAVPEEKPKTKRKKRKKPAEYPVMGPFPETPEEQSKPKTPWFLNQLVMVHRKADGSYFVTPYCPKRLRNGKMARSVKTKVVKPKVSTDDVKSEAPPEVIIVKDPDSHKTSGDAAVIVNDENQPVPEITKKTPIATIKRTVKISVGVKNKQVTPALGKRMLKFVLAKLKRKSGSSIPKSSPRGIQKTRVKKPIPVITITDDKEKTLSTDAPMASASGDQTPPASGEQPIPVVTTDNKDAPKRSESAKKPTTSARRPPTIIKLNGKVVVDDQKRPKPKSKVPKLSGMCKKVLLTSGIPLPPEEKSLVPAEKKISPEHEPIDSTDQPRNHATIRIQVKKAYSFKKSCFDTMSIGNYIRATRPLMWQMWSEEKRKQSLKMSLTKLEMYMSGRSDPKIKLGQKVKLSLMPKAPPPSQPKKVEAVEPVAKPAPVKTVESETVEKPAPMKTKESEAVEKPAPVKTVDLVTVEKPALVKTVEPKKVAKRVRKPASKPSETFINVRPPFTVHPGYPINPNLPPVVLPPLVPVNKPISPVKPDIDPIVIDADDEGDDEPVFLGTKKFRPMVKKPDGTIGPRSPIKPDASEHPIVINDSKPGKSVDTSDDDEPVFLGTKKFQPMVKKPDGTIGPKSPTKPETSKDPIVLNDKPGATTAKKPTNSTKCSTKADKPTNAPSKPKTQKVPRTLHCTRFMAERIIADPRYKVLRMRPLPIGHAPLKVDDNEPDVKVMISKLAEARMKQVVGRNVNINTGEAFKKLSPNGKIVHTEFKNKEKKIESPEATKNDDKDASILKKAAAEMKEPMEASEQPDDDLVFLGIKKFQPMEMKPDGTIDPKSPMKPITSNPSSAPTVGSGNAESDVKVSKQSPQPRKIRMFRNVKTGELVSKLPPNGFVRVKENDAKQETTTEGSKKAEMAQPVLVDNQAAPKTQEAKKTEQKDDDDDLVFLGVKKFQPLVLKSDGSKTHSKLVPTNTTSTAVDSKSSAPIFKVPKIPRKYRNIKTGELITILPNGIVKEIADKPAARDTEPKPIGATEKDQKSVKAEATKEADKPTPTPTAAEPMIIEEAEPTAPISAEPFVKPAPQSSSRAGADEKKTSSNQVAPNAATKEAKTISPRSISSERSEKKTCTKPAIPEPPKRPNLSGTMAQVQKYVDRRLAKALRNKESTLATEGSIIVKVVRLEVEPVKETKIERLAKVLRMESFRKIVKEMKKSENAPKPKVEQVGEVITVGDDGASASTSSDVSATSQVQAEAANEVEPQEPQPIATDEPMESSGEPTSSKDQPEAVHLRCTEESTLAESIITDEPMETDAPKTSEGLSEAKPLVVTDEPMETDAQVVAGGSESPVVSSDEPTLASKESDKKSEDVPVITETKKTSKPIELLGKDRVMVEQLLKEVKKHKKELRRKEEQAKCSDKIARRPAGICKTRAKPLNGRKAETAVVNPPTEPSAEPSAEPLKPDGLPPTLEAIPPTAESSIAQTVPCSGLQKTDEPERQKSPEKSEESLKKQKKVCEKCGKRYCWKKRKLREKEKKKEMKKAEKEKRKIEKKKKRKEAQEKKKKKKKPLPPGISVLKFRSLDGLEIPGMKRKVPTVEEPLQDKPITEEPAAEPIESTEPVPSTENSVLPEQPPSLTQSVPVEPAAEVFTEPSEPTAQPLPTAERPLQDKPITKEPAAEEPIESTEPVLPTESPVLPEQPPILTESVIVKPSAEVSAEPSEPTVEPVPTAEEPLENKPTPEEPAAEPTGSTEPVPFTEGPILPEPPTTLTESVPFKPSAEPSEPTVERPLENKPTPEEPAAEPIEPTEPVPSTEGPILPEQPPTLTESVPCKPSAEGSAEPLEPTAEEPSENKPITEEPAAEPTGSTKPVPSTENSVLPEKPPTLPQSVPVEPSEPTVEPVLSASPQPTDSSSLSSSALPEVEEASNPAPSTEIVFPPAKLVVEPLTTRPVPFKIKVKSSLSELSSSNDTDTSTPVIEAIWKDGPNPHLIAMAKRKKKGLLEKMRKILRG